MSLERRLAKLEQHWGERPCPTCGHGDVLVVVFNDAEASVPERCPTCGRQRPVMVVQFDTVDTRCPSCGHVYAGGDDQPCPQCGRLPHSQVIRLQWPEHVDGRG